MPKRQSKGSEDRPRGSGNRAAGKKDVFARLDEEVVDKLDEMVETMRPRTTRSAVVAELIERYIRAEYDAVMAKAKAEQN